jgi:succinyl-CoA synthetase alpha subunit
MMGPNIYGFYYTPSNLCATFCTAYDVKGSTALSSQSGGIGMAIIGFSRSAKMGVSAIVGLGNKSDIDEDDLLIFFEQDPNTNVIAQHCEDLKDGRAFAEVAKRVSKKKPVIMLKAGRTSAGRGGGQLAHRGAGRQRQDLRRRAAPVGRDPRQEPARPARLRARRADPADAEGRERRSSSPAPAAPACCSRTPASTTA